MSDLGITAIVAVIILIALGMLVVVRRGRPAGPQGDASTRARDVARAALNAVHEARSANPSLGAEELRVVGLMAASGESEGESKARLEKAKAMSALHATLQMLLVGVAARNERALADVVGSEQLMKNIVEAQKEVMGLIPGDL